MIYTTHTTDKQNTWKNRQGSSKEFKLYKFLDTDDVAYNLNSQYI